MRLFTLSQDPRFDMLRESLEFRELARRVNAGGIPVRKLQLAH
jgi:hypothetical protein